ncbi:MAG: caspase family protein, partial [Chloroflexota bacterium]
ITNASQKLNKCDILMVSYSGHGGQIPDYTGDVDQFVKVEEIDVTWCLYDGQLLDDELNVLWSKFKKGVRILVFSDSCHSGTVTRATDEEEEDDEDSGKSRAMPWDEAIETYRNNSDFYNGIGENTPSSAVDVPAAVLLISGCQDEQLSREGMINGRFTGNLKRVLKEGDFKNYKEFHQKIVDRMPDNQTPNYFGQGDFAEFEAERPFTI